MQRARRAGAPRRARAASSASRGRRRRRAAPRATHSSKSVDRATWTATPLGLGTLSANVPPRVTRAATGRPFVWLHGFTQTARLGPSVSVHSGRDPRGLDARPARARRRRGGLGGPRREPPSSSRPCCPSGDGRRSAATRSARASRCTSRCAHPDARRAPGALGASRGHRDDAERAARLAARRGARRPRSTRRRRGVPRRVAGAPDVRHAARRPGRARRAHRATRRDSPTLAAPLRHRHPGWLGDELAALDAPTLALAGELDAEVRPRGRGDRRRPCRTVAAAARRRRRPRRAPRAARRRRRARSRASSPSASPTTHDHEAAPPTASWTRAEYDEQRQELAPGASRRRPGAARARRATRRARARPTARRRSGHRPPTAPAAHADVEPRPRVVARGARPGCACPPRGRRRRRAGCSPRAARRPSNPVATPSHQARRRGCDGAGRRPCRRSRRGRSTTNTKSSPRPK